MRCTDQIRTEPGGREHREQMGMYSMANRSDEVRRKSNGTSSGHHHKDIIIKEDFMWFLAGAKSSRPASRRCSSRRLLEREHCANAYAYANVHVHACVLVEQIQIHEYGTVQQAAACAPHRDSHSTGQTR